MPRDLWQQYPWDTRGMILTINDPEVVLTYTGKRLILDRAIPNKDEIVQSFDGSLLTQ